MLAELIQIVKDAGQLALETKKEQLQVNRKDESNWNYATQADPVVERAIMIRLHAKFPGIPIIGEEQDEHHIPGGTFFTVDPIDGTIPYSNGFSNWGTIIGFIENGQPCAGVINLPELGLMISVKKGEGTYLNDQRVRLDYPRSLSESVVEIEVGPWTPEDRWPAVSTLRTKCCWLGGSGFVAASIANLLLGKSGAYPNFNAKIWDFSASALAVTEAGGIVCQPSGEPLQWDQINMQALFAANNQLAGEVLAIINQK